MIRLSAVLGSGWTVWFSWIQSVCGGELGAFWGCGDDSNEPRSVVERDENGEHLEAVHLTIDLDQRKAMVLPAIRPR